MEDTPNCFSPQETKLNLSNSKVRDFEKVNNQTRKERVLFPFFPSSHQFSAHSQRLENKRNSRQRKEIKALLNLLGGFIAFIEHLCSVTRNGHGPKQWRSLKVHCLCCLWSFLKKRIDSLQLSLLLAALRYDFISPNIQEKKNKTSWYGSREGVEFYSSLEVRFDLQGILP